MRRIASLSLFARLISYVCFVTIVQYCNSRSRGRGYIYVYVMYVYVYQTLDRIRYDAVGAWCCIVFIPAWTQTEGSLCFTVYHNITRGYVVSSQFQFTLQISPTSDWCFNSLHFWCSIVFPSEKTTCCVSKHLTIPTDYWYPDIFLVNFSFFFSYPITE